MSRQKAFSVSSLPLCLMVFLLVASSALAEVASTSRGAAKGLAITNVNIVDVTDGSIWRNSTIYIKDGRIVWVARHALLDHGEHLQVVNGTERYVIPGLWNMHVHLADDVSPDYIERVVLPMSVASGVSGVRDMGGNLARLKSLRERISAGKLLGPRIFFSGSMLDGPRPAYAESMAISTPEDARAAVRSLASQGVDFVKVQSLVPRSAYFALADEAKAQRLMVFGHVPDAVTVSEASDAGQRSMEHMLNLLRGCSTEERQLMVAADDFTSKPDVSAEQTNAFAQAQRERILRTFSQAKATALFDKLTSNRNWQTPTLVQLRFFEYADVGEWQKDERMRFVPSSLQAKWTQQRAEFLRGRTAANLDTWKAFFRKNRELVGQMRRRYVHFLAGTDNGPYVFPGSGLLDELQLMVANGFTPLEALKSATIEAAIVMQRQREYGAVAQGRMADIVFLDGNPLDDIANVRKISGVVLNGRYYDRHDLDQIEAGAARAAAGMH